METIQDKSTSHPQDAFLMSMATFADLKKVLGDLFDTGSIVILYQAGLGCGRQLYHRISRKDSSRKEILEAFANIKFKENWGKIRFGIDLDRGSGYVIVRNSFESKFYDLSSTPVCHYLRGYIVGFLSEMFKRELEIREARCIAMGDKNCCFKIR